MNKFTTTKRLHVVTLCMLAANVGYLSCGVLAAGPSPEIPYYAMRVIGAPATLTPTAISPRGIITGQFMSGGVTGAFTWDNGHYHQYIRSSWGDTIGLAVNDSGLVVGYVFHGTRTKPFYADLTQGVVTFDPLGTRWATARDVSSTGRIVGEAVSPNNPNQTLPFVWENGEGFALPIPLGFESGIALAINDVGIVGGSVTIDRDLPAQWDKDGLAILPLLPGYRSGAITAINNLRQSVGTIVTTDGQRTGAMVWNWDFEPILLPTLGGMSASALALNDVGVIVGQAQRSDGTTAGTVWLNRQAFDLSHHITFRPDVDVHRAVGVDAFGRIVAVARVGTAENVTVLLRPVPPPASVALLAIGAVVLRSRRRSGHAPVRLARGA